VTLFLPPALTYKPSDDLVRFRNRVTLALWVGLVPAAALGALISYYRQRFFSVTLINRFRSAPQGIKSKVLLSESWGVQGTGLFD
jgi:hypothetical protein